MGSEMRVRDRGSRGDVEVWPYAPRAAAKRWGEAVAHGIYKPVGESESRDDLPVNGTASSPLPVAAQRAEQNSSSTTNLSFSGYQPHLRAKRAKTPEKITARWIGHWGDRVYRRRNKLPFICFSRMVRKGQGAGDPIRRGTEQGRKD